MTKSRSVVFGACVAVTVWLIATSVTGQVRKFPASAVVPCQASVTLNDAQIKALPTSGGVEIVARVGAANLIELVSLSYSTALVADYTNLDVTASITINYDGGNADIQGLVGVRDASVADLLTGAGADAFGLVPVEDFNLYLSTHSGGVGYRNTRIEVEAANGALGDFTDGDPANTFTVSFLYFIKNTTTGVYQACP